MQYSSGTEIGKAAFDIAMRLSALSVLILTAFTSGVAQQAKFDKLASEGNLAFTAGRFAAAERAYLEALEEETKEKQASASSRLVILNALATIFNMQGRYSEAESVCQRALTLAETTSGGSTPAMANILSTVASIELHVGHYGRAEQSIRHAIAIRERSSTGDHETELVADFATLGVVLCGQGKCKQADQVVKRALRLCEPGNASCQVGLAAALTTLGAINVSRRRYGEAEDRYRAAIETLAAAYGPSNAMLVPVLAELASLYASRNRYSEAEAAGHRALEITSNELSDSDAAAKAALAIGQALAGQGHFEEAEPHFKESLAIHQRAQGAESIEYALALQQYARFLRKAKRSSEAGTIETRANALLSRAGQKVDASDLARPK